jgi:hypothetical protein
MKVKPTSFNKAAYAKKACGTDNSNAQIVSCMLG